MTVEQTFWRWFLDCRASLLFWRICLIEMCCKHMHVDVLWAQHGSFLLSQIHWLLLLAASETDWLSVADNVHRFPGLSAAWWCKKPQNLCVPLQQKTLSVRTFTFHPCCQFCPVQYFVILDLFNWMLPLWFGSRMVGLFCPSWMNVGAVMLLVAPRGKGLVGLLLRPRYSWAFMAQINVPPTLPVLWKDFLCSDSGLSYPAISELQPHFILVTIQSSVRMETQSVVGQPSSVSVSVSASSRWSSNPNERLLFFKKQFFFCQGWKLWVTLAAEL